jgi:hypothetical protein
MPKTTGLGGMHMATDWEGSFSRWATPPGQSEEDRIENAVRAVRDALDADDKLRPLTHVFVQGSYRNRVNVRADSDVDVGVLYRGNSFRVQYPSGKGDADFGNVTGDYGYKQFKDDVGAALVRHFGQPQVTRGTKAFDVRANTYRVDTDVVPLMEHRRYDEHGGYICGVELVSDAAERIINWPERLFPNDSHWQNQHYENAVAKNAETNRRFKGVVRILKTLRNLLDEAGDPHAKAVNGFLIECLVFNVPSDRFYSESWDGDVQSALAFLWASTTDDEAPSEWGEVSEWKYLFKASLGKRVLAHAFLDRAWDYIGVRS